MGGLEEEPDGGILFRNDFVIFDEAHQMERVASQHIGLSVSSGQVRYALQRLWNPRTERGLLATLRQGGPVKLVAALLTECEQFFEKVEAACEELRQTATKRSFGGGEKEGRRRDWTELRIRQPELVDDNLTLPIQRLREAVSELIKSSEDREIGLELMECNRRLGDLREEVAMFLEPKRRTTRILGRAPRPGPEELGAQCRPCGRGRVSAPPALRQPNLGHHDQRHAGH